MASLAATSHPRLIYPNAKEGDILHQIQFAFLRCSPIIYIISPSICELLSSKPNINFVAFTLLELCEGGDKNALFSPPYSLYSY